MIYFKNYDIPEGFRSSRLMMCLTQKELSEVLGISKESISNYEQGKAMPDIVTIIKLASFTKQTIANVVRLNRKSYLRSDKDYSFIELFRDLNDEEKRDKYRNFVDTPALNIQYSPEVEEKIKKFFEDDE